VQGPPPPPPQGPPTPVAGPGTTVVQGPPAPPAPAVDPNAGNRLRAQHLVAEARHLQAERRYVEARQKAVEAQRLNVAFGPDEDSPELVYRQVAFDANRQVDSLIKQAHDGASYGSGPPAERYQAAETRLSQARALATAFGQDVRPIDEKIVWVRQMRDGSQAPQAPQASQAPGTAVVSLPPALPAPAPRSPGQELLDKARLEVRKGELRTARTMTELACKPEYGVREEAYALLRSIDNEEFSQSILSARRAFDAALAAYRRRDYANAAAMLATIDTRLLDPTRLARLREMAQSPEMQPSRRGATGLAVVTDPGKGAVGAAPPPSGVVPVKGGPSVPGALVALPPDGPGRVRVSDQPGLSEDELDRVKKMRAVVFDKLRVEGLDAQRDAAERFRAGEHNVAIDILNEYSARLNRQDLSPGQLTLLRRPIENRMKHYQVVKAQMELAAEKRGTIDRQTRLVREQITAEQQKQKNIAKLMKEYNQLFKDGKYAEAHSIALRCSELDPDNPVVTAAVSLSQMQMRVHNFRDIKNRTEQFVLDTLNQAEDEGDGSAVIRNGGIALNKSAFERSKNRKPFEPITVRRLGERERAIERKLRSPITLSFTDVPLRTVIDDLRDTHNINIVPDVQALQEDAISLDQLISIKLDNVSLKSALNLILSQAKLTHVIKDEVLLVTTPAHAQGKNITVTYNVADLVIPIENFSIGPNGSSLPGLPAVPMNQPNVPGSPTPLTGPMSLQGGTPTGMPTGSLGSPGSPSSSASPFASSATPTPGTPGVTKRGPSNTMEETLIKLITSTVAPRSWSEMGGPGTIDYFPMTMALVVNQSADIQDQIFDLLNALRRLQDLEVAVEVRFITITEDFFERIGVNFSFNILNNGTTKFEPQLTSGVFQLDPRFINDFTPGRFLAGLNPAGQITSTLDIPVTVQTFAQALPPFGGYPQVPGYGGLAMGLAFLSDIQVFLFMEAVQGDTRFNVMQAPKLTMFNGQTATLTAGDFTPFVTGAGTYVNGQGQFFFQPQFNAFYTGITLTVQPVVSADRRFVRMSLTPNLTNFVTTVVPLFPIVVPVFPQLNNTNLQGQPIVFTQFIQQPVTTTLSVATTVVVPDGGTVLLGGLKRLAEGRTEFGPPILSKIPYINRLFKNVGYGREAHSLLMMVTPRIIIQEEEEERQTGFVRPPAIAVP
jgi:type II secretory pathway component GspD/PulD (secretin)